MFLVIESCREAPRRKHKGLQTVAVVTKGPVDLHKTVRLEGMALVAVISGVAMKGMRENSLLPGGELLEGMTPEAGKFSQGLVPAHYPLLGLLNLFPLRARSAGTCNDENTDA
jgi:hypothetical protein